MKIVTNTITHTRESNCDCCKQHSIVYTRNIVIELGVLRIIPVELCWDCINDEPNTIEIVGGNNAFTFIP